jgi:hypothetical protein
MTLTRKTFRIGDRIICTAVVSGEKRTNGAHGKITSTVLPANIKDHGNNIPCRIIRFDKPIGWGEDGRQYYVPVHLLKHEPKKKAKK